MAESHKGRHQFQNLAAWALLLFLGIGATLFAFFPSASDSNQQLLQALSAQRPAGGRLFHDIRISTETLPEADLGKLQLSVLVLPESQERRRLQSLLYLARENWQEAANILSALNVANATDAGILNDLGVSLMGLAAANPENYFRAFQVLELARALAPTAPAPQFNIALLYRTLGLKAQERLAAESYLAKEKISAWKRELVPPTAPDPDELIDVLRIALQRGNTPEAQRLFTENAEIFRREAMEYALSPADPEGTDPVVQFIVQELVARYADETLSFMLAPLRTSARETVIEARKLVREGSIAYVEARLPESLLLYQRAAALVTNVNSPFDRMWVDLNRADAEIRVGQMTIARNRLDSVILEARQRNTRWLLAQAQTSLGSNVPLVRNFTELLDVLTEATNTFASIGTPRDSVRALYYLAAANHMVGDLQHSLQFTFRGLALTPREEHLRLVQFFWLAGSLLQRLGYPTYATQFHEQSVLEAKEIDNTPLLAAAISSLATVQEANSSYQEAEKNLETARATADLIDSPARRIIVDFNLNLLCGRIYTRRGALAEAGACLERNLELSKSQPNLPKYFLSQSLVLLAKVFSALGDLDTARERFRQAVEVVETDDQYFATEKLRLSFDNDRRDLYDSVIAFEYDHGQTDSAWSYAQRYRSKLFLEFLALTNPAIVQIRSDAVQRNRVQTLIPRDLQIIEYVLLHDRLLIWVVSDQQFVSKSIPISRLNLEKKVDDFVALIRKEADVSLQSDELYEILIAPVERELDPTKSLAIIPDQVLHRLPFPALYDKSTARYLVESFPLIESPNLTHLLAAATSKPERDSAVSFGAVIDDTSYAREFEKLRSVYSEVSSFTGSEAVKETFIDKMSDTRMFHYAGHSTDAADPLRSSVLLDGAGGGPNSVTAVDISQQRMQPNAVVVLASCDSSVGNSRDGVGMRGLTSAFLISGAGSVVGSLWPVEVTSTSDLVIGFHEAFASEQLPVAEALRQAQLAFLKKFPEKSHPYYWSGFVVTGNTSAIR